MSRFASRESLEDKHMSREDIKTVDLMIGGDMLRGIVAVWDIIDSV
jgi:hypothetical protein